MGIGALRWEKLTRFALERGYAIDVVTKALEDIHPRDDVRLERLDPRIVIHRVAERPVRTADAWDSFARLVSRRRPLPAGTIPESSNKPIPQAAPPTAASSRYRGGSVRKIAAAVDFIDARLHAKRELSWALLAGRTLRRVVEAAPTRAIISSGPPQLHHVAASRVAKAVGCPHVADLRDPWCQPEPGPVSRRTQAKIDHQAPFEQEVVANAAVIVANTEAIANVMRRSHAPHASRIITVRNGSDVEGRVESPPRTRFVVLHTGTMYLRRDPRVIFRACAPVVREFDIAPDDFEIRFIGHGDDFDGKPIVDIAREYGLERHVTSGGLVPHAEALKAMAESSLLVVLPDGLMRSIAAKIYEYAQTDAWVLAFTESGSSLDELLRETTADVVSEFDEAAAVPIVRKRWLQFRQGEVPTRMDPEGILRREHQAAILFAAIDGL